MARLQNEKEVVLADENYIRESILYPKEKVVAGYAPVMPSYKGQLTDDDIYCLVEFLKTVSNFNNAKEETSTTVSEGADEGTEEEGN